jgi:nitroreductase
VDFYQLIENRESIRDYDPEKEVPEPVLRRIVNAGRLAPSAANRQPWRFAVVSSEAGLERIRVAYSHTWYRDAPHVLAAIGRVDEAWVRQGDGYNSLETDLTIAMDHMILAAEYEGVATCWIANFDPEKLKEALQLRENERIFAITPLGYPREGFVRKGEKKRKSLDEVYQPV